LPERMDNLNSFYYYYTVYIVNFVQRK